MTHPGDAGELIGEASRQYANGQHAEAAAMVAVALAISPEDAAAQHLSGLCHLALGQGELGIAMLEKAFATDPGNDELRVNLALAKSHHGQHQAVVDLLDNLLQCQPEALQIYQPLAMAKWEVGDKTGAIAVYRGLVDRSPHDAAAHRALGQALVQAGDPDQAFRFLQRAADLSPDDLDLAINVIECRCETLLRLPGGDPREAEAAADARVLLDRVTDVGQRIRLGVVLHRMNDIERAIEVLRDIHADLPAERAVSILLELAIAASKSLRLEEAEAHYRRAIELVPTDTPANLNLSLLDLQRGRFKDGWPRYEARRPMMPHVPAHPALGEEPWRVPLNLDGETVRVVLEQGLGDTLQFIRYLPMLAVRGARVELAVPIHQSLLPLIRGVPGIAAEVPSADTDPVPKHVVPLLSLPLAFGTELSSIPADVPYLAPPGERREKWRARFAETRFVLDTRPRIGVVWSGSAGHGNDRHRSIPLEKFRRVMARGDLAFHSLADRLRDGDEAALGGKVAIHAGIEDFADTAALVEMMDLVIAVDTSVVHLAGALGRPAWVLLPAHPDWRWLMGRDDSPWYPSLRLFRQPRHLDWGGVLDNVIAALEERYPR